MLIREIEVKSVLTKSNLPVSDYSVNPYVGCAHGCRYCYASFMKRFTGHAEPWGEFLDVKFWPEIKRPERYRGKELFFGSVPDPYLPQEETYRRTRARIVSLSMGIVVAGNVTYRRTRARIVSAKTNKASRVYGLMCIQFTLSSVSAAFKPEVLCVLISILGRRVALPSSQIH
jgi:hypothetical protein